MPSVTANQIKTLAHLMNTVRYLGDVEHAFHEYQEIQNTRVCGGPETPEEYADNVFRRTALFNMVALPRQRVRTLATGIAVAFPTDFDISTQEEKEFEKSALRVVAWDGLVLYNWHRKINKATRRKTPHLHIVVSTIAEGIIVTLRRMRLDNLLLRLRRAMDACLERVNAQRTARGEPLIPDMVAIKAKKTDHSIERKLASEAACQGMETLPMAQLPVLLRSIGLVEYSDWEIDFQLRIRFRPRPKAKQSAADVVKRPFSIQIFDLLRSINKILAQRLGQEKHNKPAIKVKEKDNTNGYEKTDREKNAEYRREDHFGPS